MSDIFPGNKPAKRCRATLSTLKNLQDSLGALNDLARREVLSFDRAWARGLGAGSSTGPDGVPKAFKARVAFAAQGTRVAQLLHEAKRTFKTFSHVKPFWE